MAKLKSLPNNETAEKSVLGAILIDRDAINIVSERLTPAHFYNEINSVIFEAMLALSEARKPIDMLTISDHLKKLERSVAVEASYFTELVEIVPTAANIEHYAEIVREAATKRSLIRAGTEIAEMSYDEQNEIKEVLDKAESSIFSISQGNITRGFVPIKDTLSQSFDRIDELHKGGEGLRGVKTGFTDLDHVLSGFQKSNLIILAARPGTGKTAIVLNMAQSIATVDKKPVAIFSLEMSKEELVDRFLVAQADVDAWRLKTGKLSEEDFTKLSDAMGKLAEAPIFIDDTPGLTMAEMRSKARRLHMEHGLGLIIVDYLQLVNPGRKVESRVQEVSIVSQGLKNLARELNVPLLSASQLSRAVEHRGEKRPQLADLRESGAIEQDADVVMFLYRPDTDYDITNHNIPTKLLIAKHRNGATGEIDLLFRGDRIRFYNVEKSHTTPVE
jgi:replicative DNA helicase